MNVTTSTAMLTDEDLRGLAVRLFASAQSAPDDEPGRRVAAFFEGLALALRAELKRRATVLDYAEFDLGSGDDEEGGLVSDMPAGYLDDVRPDPDAGPVAE